MLCSRCSEPVTPIVAIDIDGTLGDYHGHFARFAESYLDHTMSTQYEGHEHYREWFCEEFVVDLTTFREVKLAYRQGGMKRTMRAFDGAAQFTYQLMEEGYEVWLTTTRPYLRLDGVDRDTREWLRRNEITYDKLLYDENKYHVMATRVDRDRVVGILDDEWQQLHNAEAAFGAGRAIMRSTPYNAAVGRDMWMGDRASRFSIALNLIANRKVQVFG